MVQHESSVFWLDEQQDKLVYSEGARVLVLFFIFHVLEQLLLLVKGYARGYADQPEAVLSDLRVLLVYKLECRLDQPVSREKQNGKLVLPQ